MSALPNRLPHIAVVGGGANGLIAALCLQHALQDRVQISLFDASLDKPFKDQNRVVALAQAGLDLLRKLNVWDAIEAQAQPVTRLVLSDSALDEPLRAPLLTFGENEPLAAIIPNMHLINAARNAAQTLGIALVAKHVSSLTQDTFGATLFSENDQQSTYADLIVLADGATSNLRDTQDFGWIEKQYGQTALVATVSHQFDHQGRAFQHFLPSGPFAILPLRANSTDQTFPYRSSLVWTEKREVASHMVKNDDILGEIMMRAGPELGDMRLESPVRAFPLWRGLAREWIKGRIVLLGDSAHIVHPLAGQGLHLGMQDAACLAQCLEEAIGLGLDVADNTALSTYVQIRRPAAVAMALATESLNMLFSNDITPLRLIRSLGFGLVERSPWLKDAFTRIAAGHKANE
jgi:2-octaprenyl-6-methoxyphenol hydroxylase